MRRVLAAALRHWISAIGVALTTASALLFLFFIALDLLGLFQNPYVGIIIFVIVPAVFVVGLACIPVGLWLEQRQRRVEAPGSEWPRLDLRDPGTRRMLGFVAVASLVNLAIISTASFGAVEYTESREFCGQVCHDVMGPEFVAHQNGLHARILCVSCHVGPGAGAFLTAKLNGTRQLGLVVSGKYTRPIPTPIEDMPDVQLTCDTVTSQTVLSVTRSRCSTSTPMTRPTPRRRLRFDCTSAARFLGPEAEPAFTGT
jgi:hypothetical protein